MQSGTAARAESGGRESSPAVTVEVAAHDARLLSQVHTALGGDGFQIVAQASDARAAVREALEHAPQICLVQADLPGGTVGAVSAILAHLPETRVAMLADSVSNGRALRAVKVGADGILDRSEPAAELRREVALLARGKLPLAEDVVTKTDVVEPELLPERPEGSPVGWVLLFLPRFVRHLWRRLRSGMGLRQSWTSARDRVNEY